MSFLAFIKIWLSQIFIVSTVNISHQFSRFGSHQPRFSYQHIPGLQNFPPMYCKLPTTLSNNMNNIWEVNSINLLLSWKILWADSQCFVSSFHLAWGCVLAHSSVFSGIFFHLCSHSHVGIVLVLSPMCVGWALAKTTHIPCYRCRFPVVKYLTPTQ